MNNFPQTFVRPQNRQRVPLQSVNKVSVRLTGVCETALIPLFYRALESQRPDAIIRDPVAASLIEQIDYDFSVFNIDAPDRVFALMRSRQFDRYARSFLAKYPDAIVVDIGCGLDTRSERLDNGVMQWYGLDFPEVIELRRELLHETARSRFLPYSATDPRWMEQVCTGSPHPFLFLAEGVFPYLEAAQVRTVIVALADRFPESEIVFDGMSSLFMWLHNRRALLKQLNVHLGWGLRDPRDLEKWGSNIRFVSKWGYFDEPEPRLGRHAWLRYVPCLRDANWVAIYVLGEDLKMRLQCAKACHVALGSELAFDGVRKTR
jgi:O-methyltransferase involved in polyketide biosynthesis